LSRKFMNYMVLFSYHVELSLADDKIPRFVENFALKHYVIFLLLLIKQEKNGNKSIRKRTAVTE